MVVKSALGDHTPAVVVPDEQTWTLLGSDPVALGVEPIYDRSKARHVLAPRRLPAAMTTALDGLLEDWGADVVVERGRELLLPEAEAETGHQGSESPEHEHEDRVAHDEDHEDHAGHGAQDDSSRNAHAVHDGEDGQGDAMAITGEPSADGLIMEPIELRLGPLGTPLPGGLTVDVTCDGDVVSTAFIRGLEIATWHQELPSVAPDPLAPRSWSAAIATATGAGDISRWRWIAAVELERAVSHMAWFRALSRLLGWAHPIRAATSVIRQLLDWGSRLASEEERCADVRWPFFGAKELIDDLIALVEGNRALRWRLAGRGATSLDEIVRLGATGPVARAAGAPVDARTPDPAYRAIGFSPQVRADGDALARTLLRLAEAAEAISLAESALTASARGNEAPPPPDDRHGSTIEGPRGPLQIHPETVGWQLAAPGTDAALALAMAAMVGEEWGSAIATLASFDLSSWQIKS